MSRHFVYRPLEAGRIRLLRLQPDSVPSDIRCQMVHDSLADGEYAALSYCWGDPRPVANITINDVSFGVAQNLHAFLRVSSVAGSGENRTFWIDAICINQDDPDEKSAQVASMWQIYQNATIVASWLGDEEKYSAVAFQALQDLGNQVERLGLGGIAQVLASEHFARPGREAIEAVIALTQNPYFQRMWIVQEVLNARKLLLVSGQHHCEMNYLAMFVSMLEATKHEDEGLLDVSSNALDILYEYTLLKASDHVYGPARFSHLSDAIGDSRWRKCSDPRDKIFALLGLPSVRAINAMTQFKPDYAMTVEEVLVAALSWYDSFGNKRQAGTMPSTLVDVVGDFGFTLGINISGPHFRPWLQKRIAKSLDEETDILRLPSGSWIDCSGEVLQDILHGGPIFEAVKTYEPFPE